MIIPTLLVERFTEGGADIHGQSVLTRIGFEKCAPVKLQFSAQHSTVRTDSAASHGHASESTANVVLLMLPSSTIDVDDILIVLGNKVKVVQRHPRYAVTGRLDHIEVQANAWK